MDLSAAAVSLGKGATYACWLAAAAGALVMLRRERTRWQALALMIVAGAYIGGTATSFWEGARLTFPVEWVLFVFVAGVFG